MPEEKFPLKEAVDITPTVSRYAPQLKDPFNKILLIAGGGQPYGEAKYDPQTGKRYVDPDPWYLQFFSLLAELKKGYEAELEALEKQEERAETEHAKNLIRQYKEALELTKDTIDELEGWTKQWTEFYDVVLETQKGYAKRQAEAMEEGLMQPIKEAEKRYGLLKENAFD